MKLIVGLGNPGKQYAFTRHNAGWLSIDRLAEVHHATWTEDKQRHAQVAKFLLGQETVLLAKPQTFMNDSGQALRALLAYYKDIKPEDLIIVHDELDVEPGALKISQKAGSGGHNGIKSLFEETQTTELPRLRIGIGRPPGKTGIAVDGWVLGGIEQATIDIATKQAVQALEQWIVEGLARTMNTWNQKPTT